MQQFGSENQSWDISSEFVLCDFLIISRGNGGVKACITGTNGPGFEFCLKEPLTFSPRIFYILSQLHGGVCGTTMALRLPFSCLIAGNRRTVLPILQHEWVTRMTFAKSPTLLHCDKASRQTASWKWRIRCGNFPWCPKEKQTRNNLNSSFKTHKGTREKHLVLLF